ncbi:MAG: hypothetical protein HYU39_03235 [Thaumarchaeota archaeon]|nr:hypothetical protein [Nitrososphaerota archaeon]
MREFFEYADERRMKGEFDITKITREYYTDELKPYFEENGHKASLFLKKFLVMTRMFVETDPRHQSRMDAYISKYSKTKAV